MRQEQQDKLKSLINEIRELNFELYKLGNDLANVPLSFQNTEVGKKSKDNSEIISDCFEAICDELATVETILN